MVTLENGGIIKSIHGGLYRDSIWYSVYGSKGRMECGREDAQDGHIHKIYVNCDEYSGQYRKDALESYEPKNEVAADVQHFGHGGSDFYSMYYFAERIRGDVQADIIDVYEAMDMFLPGMFAYRSILAGGIPMQIPNLRDPAQREQWRNDTACSDPKVPGDMLLPTFSLGTPEIDDGVYEHVKALWEAECNGGEGNYRSQAFHQGANK